MQKRQIAIVADDDDWVDEGGANKYKKPQAAPVELKKRGCLMCNRGFLSEGPHNRVCRKCKSTQLWREGEYEAV